MRKRTLLLLGVLVLGLLTPGGPAVAKKRKVKEKHVTSFVRIISLSEETQFAGVVQAKEERLCKRGRRIHIARGGTEIATATTDHRGHWTTATGAPLARGDRLIARVDESKIKKSRFRVTVCDVTVSGAVEIHQLDVKVTGKGLVNSAPDGIDGCRSDSPAAACSAIFTATGTALNAFPDAANHFDHWDHACDQRATIPHCDLPMTQDYLLSDGTEVDAIFAAGEGPPETCPTAPVPLCPPFTPRP